HGVIYEDLRRSVVRHCDAPVGQPRRVRNAEQRRRSSFIGSDGQQGRFGKSVLASLGQGSLGVRHDLHARRVFDFHKGIVPGGPLTTRGLDHDSTACKHAKPPKCGGSEFLPWHHRCPCMLLEQPLFSTSVVILHFPSSF